MREDDNAELFVGESVGLGRFSTIHDVMHVVKSNFSVKRFCNGTAWPYYRLFFETFYSNEKIPKHRHASETAEYS